MKIVVLVKANSRRRRVETIDANTLRLFVKSPAKEGKANDEVVALLAKHYSVAKSNITIRRGLKTSKKFVVIATPAEI